MEFLQFLVGMMGLAGFFWLADAMLAYLETYTDPNNQH